MSGVLKYQQNLKPRKHEQSLHFFTGYHHIAPLDEEVSLETKKYMVHKIDTEGKIEYCNRYFSQVNGYSEDQIIGTPHTTIYHPDMPAAILDLVWDSIFHRKTTMLLLKGITKEGKFYWSQAEYSIQINRAVDDIQGFFCYAQEAPQNAVTEIEELYRKLKSIEKRHGIEKSSKYLNNFLQEQRIGWNDYMNDMLDTSFAYRLSNLTKKLFAPRDNELTLAS